MKIWGEKIYLVTFHVYSQFSAQFVTLHSMMANLEGTHLKESVESTPPANRHSHHPTTHRGAFLDGETYCTSLELETVGAGAQILGK